MLRSSVADYEVIRALPATGTGQARYLCQSPDRLFLDGASVWITELAVDAVRLARTSPGTCHGWRAWIPPTC